MNWLMRFLGYFGRVLMPARFRQQGLEYRVTRSLDKVANKLEKPDEAILHAADKTVKKIEKQPLPGEPGYRPGAAEGAAGAAPEALGQPAAGKSWWSRIGTFLRWVLHFVLVAAVLVGLWYLNRVLGVERLLRSDWPVLHPYWLPILFLLLYLLIWLGTWLWRLTGPDNVGWDYPDINQAWDEAVGALADAGMDVREVPLFLVLGRPQGAEDVLFEGAGLALRVAQTPRRRGAPLHVYATQNAVFVTCVGASVLGVQTALLVEEASSRAQEQDAAPTTARNGGLLTSQDAEGEEVLSAARTSAADILEDSDTASATPTPETEPAPITVEQQRILGLLDAEEEMARPRTQSQARLFLKNTAEVQLLTYRLQHLCRLLTRDRRPYCPLNGVLVLLPLAATADDRDASAAGTACRYDLTLLHDVLQVRCPAFALVSDMEESAGFREFLQRLPAGPRVRRMGQRFPLLPDVDEEAIPEMVEKGLDWLSGVLLPSLVYNLFRVESPGRQTAGAAEVLDGNIRLYQFLTDLRERRKRLARLLTRAFLLDVPGAVLFGGVYFAATNPSAGPSFVGGVLGRLVESQNYVSWTPEALDTDSSYRRWRTLGCLAILALIVSVPVLAYFFWRW